MRNKKSNIVVVGQGAMGLLWYHHLAQAKTQLNISVSVLASSQMERLAINESSKEYLFTAYQDKSSNTYPVNYAQISDIKAADILLICVKSYQVSDAIRNISTILPTDCLIILANNGMGVFEEVADILPKKQLILAMLTTHGSLRHSPLNIEHTGLGESNLGLLTAHSTEEKDTKENDTPTLYQRLDGFDSSLKAQLTEQLDYALPKVSYHHNIIEKQWLKLAINCVINPITAIHNLNNGEVNNSKFTVQVSAILSEIIDVAHSELHANVTQFKLRELIDIVANVARATAKNCSSMRSDVLAGRKTEIDYINGYIHRLGEKYNIATPENTRLWQTVKALTKR